VRVCVSMTVADHLRSAKVHFYQLGLGASNTVTDRGWRLMTLNSIRSKLGHAEVCLDHWTLSVSRLTPVHIAAAELSLAG